MADCGSCGEESDFDNYHENKPQGMLVKYFLPVMLLLRYTKVIQTLLCNVNPLIPIHVPVVRKNVDTVNIFLYISCRLCISVDTLVGHVIHYSNHVQSTVDWDP